MPQELSRIVALSVFWIPYVAIPWFTGWFYASNVDCAFCWGDILRFALSLFGYGAIGVLFFALTGRSRDPQDFKGRLLGAMGINLCIFLFSIYLVADWEIITL